MTESVPRRQDSRIVTELLRESGEPAQTSDVSLLIDRGNRRQWHIARVYSSWKTRLYITSMSMRAFDVPPWDAEVSRKIRAGKIDKRYCTRARVIRRARSSPAGPSGLAELRNCHYHSRSETYDVSRDLYIDNSRRYLFTFASRSQRAVNQISATRGPALFRPRRSSQLAPREAAGAVMRETRSYSPSSERFLSPSLSLSSALSPQ